MPQVLGTIIFLVALVAIILHTVGDSNEIGAEQSSGCSRSYIQDPSVPGGLATYVVCPDGSITRK